uniref:EMI domain-containing protein n=1 Tax=Maylandia zebra TaxID=106582 RepID=A0A3P9D756_9CICH
MSHREEAPGQTQDTLERLYLSAGGWGEGGLGLFLTDSHHTLIHLPFPFPCFNRNWCAYVVTRTVSCVMEDGVETYIKPDYQRCAWGQCPRVAYRTYRRPRYKVDCHSGPQGTPETGVADTGGGFILNCKKMQKNNGRSKCMLVPIFGPSKGLLIMTSHITSTGFLWKYLVSFFGFWGL